MNRCLLLMVLLLSALGMRAQVTATFDDPPGKEFEELPMQMYFTLSEPMNGVSPKVVFKAGEHECELLSQRDQTYQPAFQRFYVWVSAYVSADALAAAQEAGEFSLIVTLNDGTVLDPFVYKMKKEAQAITATFDDEPGKEFEELPMQMFFTLSEPMVGVSPKVVFKAGEQVSELMTMRDQTYQPAYQRFYVWVSSYVSAEALAAAQEAGEFSLIVTLNDGTVLDPFVYKMKAATPAITATFEDEPGKEFEELPMQMFFTLSEPMVGVSPKVVFKAGEQQSELMTMRDQTYQPAYQRFYVWVSSYVSADALAAAQEAGEFSLIVTLNDGTVLDPFNYKLKQPAAPITASFLIPENSVFAGMPESLKFSLSEEIQGVSPKLYINDRELTAYRDNNSYQNFYAFVSYYVSDMLESLMEAGKFTAEVELADGTKAGSVEYYLVSSDLDWTANAENPVGKEYTTLPESLSFTLSAELPAEGVYGAGLMYGDAMPAEFTGWDATMDYKVEGTTVTFDLTSLSAEAVSALMDKENFIVALQLANKSLTAGYVLKVRRQQVTLGYCSDDFDFNSGMLGTQGNSSTVGAAIKIPSAKLEALKGCEIKKIRIGIGAGLERVYGWIRPSLSQPALTMQRLEDTSDGWHEIVFDTPYTITGDEIYVGYSGYQPAGVKAIRAGGDDRADACWLGIADVWEDCSAQGYGALYIQAFTEAVLPENDLGVDNVVLDAPYYKTGTKAEVSLMVMNSGANTVESYSIGWSIDGAEVTATQVNTPLPSDGRVKHTLTVPLENIADGVHTLAISCKINDAGVQDDVEGNNIEELPLAIYSTSYPRTMLLENFTTMLCNNCPNGHASITKAIEGRDDVAWVAHHVGYGTDQFTVEESNAYLDFDVLGAPSMMIDRRVIKGTTPPVTIGYTNTTAGGAIIADYLNYAASIPAFAAVNLSNAYDEDSRKLTITMQLEKNDIFSALTPDCNYTLFLTEDGLMGDRPQAGADMAYVHNHVLRAVLTPEFGNPVEWDGNTMTATFETVLDESWKPWNMSIIGFINKPFKADALGDCEVMNTAVDKVNAVESVKMTAVDEAIRMENGSFVSDGATVEVYAVDGKHLANSGLEAGIYLVRLTYADGSVKVIKTYLN